MVLLASVILVLLLLFAGSNVSAANVEEDVHGLSYRDNSILRLGILPGSNIAYTNVDWYVTANGNVEIYTDGVLTDSFAVNGLYVLKTSYDPGQRYNVSVRINGISSYNFTLDVRNNITLTDIEENPGTVLSMTSSELTVQQLMYAAIGSIVAGIAIYIAYKHRRAENRRGWHF